MIVAVVLWWDIAGRTAKAESGDPSYRKLFTGIVERMGNSSLAGLDITRILQTTKYCARP